MRLIYCTILTLAAAGTATLAGTGAFAQGVKDSANYGTVSNSRSNSASTESSRPTTVRNMPTTSMPSGMAVQRVYRDGKLVTIAR